MSPSRWDQINRLFLKCYPLGEQERNATLDLACGDDRELRSEVELLVRADAANRVTGFLRPSSSASLSRLMRRDEGGACDGAASGGEIGRYCLHELIGRGGTSEVYRACLRDCESRAGNGPAIREFAFKLISRHIVTGEIVERFRIEEKLLASIDHPNVAHFVDGGTTGGGLPYLVMELSAVPRLACTMRHDCFDMMGWYRRTGELTDATRACDQLLSLADRLVAIYPTQAAPLLLLSEVYVQKAKNTVRENGENRGAIDRWQRKSLDVLIRARAIEPHNDEVNAFLTLRISKIGETFVPK